MNQIRMKRRLIEQKSERVLISVSPADVSADFSGCFESQGDPEEWWFERTATLRVQAPWMELSEPLRTPRPNGPVVMGAFVAFSVPGNAPERRFWMGMGSPERTNGIDGNGVNWPYL